MNTKMLNLSIVVASLAISGMVSAATITPKADKARCDQLTAQFDSAKSAHATDPKLAKAVSARDRGVQNCKSGEYGMGETALSSALKDIGVTPSSHKS